MTKPKTDGNETGRDRAGRFQAGNPGGPGRRSGKATSTALREKLAQDVEAVVEVVRQQALAGDVAAARLLLDKLLPSLRPVEVPAELDLPAGGLAAQAQAVVQAAALGDLAPGQAAQLVAALAGVGKIIETTELMARIEALEAAATSWKG
jgi:hypothetical protein